MSVTDLNHALRQIRHVVDTFFLTFNKDEEPTSKYFQSPYNSNDTDLAALKPLNHTNDRDSMSNKCL